MESDRKCTYVDMCWPIRVPAHHLQKLASGMIEWDRIRSRAKTDRLVATVLIRLETSSTMVLRFRRILGIVQSVRSLAVVRCSATTSQTDKNRTQTHIVPDVDHGSLKRLAL